MPSRDIWSPGSGSVLADSISSALATLLFRSDDRRPVYFSSPWITEFPLFQNQYREFADLFPDLADESEIRFSDYLVRLAREREVRVLTANNEYSRSFVMNERLRVPRLCWKFAERPYHEKGILGPDLYIEGSMNITYKGMFINREKVTLHSGNDAYVKARVAASYLEFDRHWENLDVGD